MQFNILKCLRLSVILTAFLGLSFSLGGCAGTDVQLDVPGLRGVTLGGKPKEKKVAARGGLVIPPSTKKLPDPNQIATRSEQEQQVWPDDPDERKKKQAALAKQEDKNRREGLDKDGNPDFDAIADGGAPKRGILDRLIKGDLFKKDEEEE